MSRPPTRNPRIYLGEDGATPHKTVRFSYDDAPNTINRATPERADKKAPAILLIFMVDKSCSKEYGTDQRRQRATVANYTDELT